MFAALLLLLACPAPSGDDSDSPVTDDSHTGDTEPDCDPVTWQDTGVQVGVIDGACRCEEPIVEVGTGSEAYEAVEDLAGITMVHGAQNGWHMLSAVRLLNLRNIVEITATVTDVQSGVAVTDLLVYRVQTVDGDTCEGTFYNMYLYLDPAGMAVGELDTAPELLSCREQSIELCVSDTGGRRVCGVKSIIAIPDPVDVESGMATSCDEAPEE